jgi:hypothetical protein
MTRTLCYSSASGFVAGFSSLHAMCLVFCPLCDACVLFPAPQVPPEVMPQLYQYMVGVVAPSVFSMTLAPHFNLSDPQCAAVRPRSGPGLAVVSEGLLPALLVLLALAQEVFQIVSRCASSGPLFRVAAGGRVCDQLAVSLDAVSCAPGGRFFLGPTGWSGAAWVR